MSTVIHTENLGKRYRLGVLNSRRLYDDVQSFFLRLRGKKDLTLNLSQDGTPIDTVEKREIWAIKDINFEVKDGDVVGIIGRNGSGKSTLLKVLSRITAPTTGSVRLRGRVASLLEVGTGFNAELTGRENVYLNGSILGMTKADINRRFDEIVEFAGVGRFLETPVKRYSSGMFVRLAFAVAAHLDPDILIVDEVLAVGDASFQRKCLNRISNVAREGRTILFVSHQAAAVENLCKRGIVLDAGQKVFEGTQVEALDYYAKHADSSRSTLDPNRKANGTGGVRITGIELRKDGKPTPLWTSGRDCEVRLKFEAAKGRTLTESKVEIFVSTHFDAPVFKQDNTMMGSRFTALPDNGTFVCRIPKLPVPAGLYRISFRLRANMDYELLDEMKSAAEIEVEEGDFFGTGIIPKAAEGVALVPAEWQIAD